MVKILIIEVSEYKDIYMFCKIIDWITCVCFTAVEKFKYLLLNCALYFKQKKKSSNKLEILYSMLFENSLKLKGLY